MADVQARRNEIAAKKAKLAELRRQRELREQERSSKSAGKDDTTVEGGTTPSKTESRREEIDDLVNSLLPSNTQGSPYASPANRKGRSSLRSSLAGPLEPADLSVAEQVSQIPSNYQSAETQTDLEFDGIDDAVGHSTYEHAPSRPSVSSAGVYTVSIGIQTDPTSWRSSSRSDSMDSRASDRSISPTIRRHRRHMSRIGQNREAELRERIRKEVEEELKLTKSGTFTEDITNESAPARYPARELSEDEKKAVTASEDFMNFLDRSSKVIERAYDQDYDVLKNYAQDDTLEFDDDGNPLSGGPKVQARTIREIGQFWDERGSRKRMVSDISFSQRQPGLFLVSYTKNPTAPQEPQGLVQVWETQNFSSPLHTFHASSDVLTARFSPFNQNLVFGGTYTGQVLIWRIGNGPMPIQKTFLTGGPTGGHTHPVYSLSIVGTQNAHNIISCSTDGVVCGWNVDILSQPQEYIELTAISNKNDSIAPTCMAFAASDPTTFLVGTEEGSIFTCQRYDRAGAKAGIDTKVKYSGHTAPVMSLDFHSSRGPVDLGDLLLTTSLDWSVKLWKIRAAAASVAQAKPNTTAASSSNTAQEVLPLIDFGREEVVYDARWSPARPGVFALVDGAGDVEVWDILNDLEVPAAKVTPLPNKKASGLEPSLVRKSLSCVAWDEKDGKLLAVGGLNGLVTLFEVGSQLSGESVRPDDWVQVRRAIGKAERAQGL